MLQGDLLTPTLFGLPYFHKPPLAYWINAAAIGVFGPHEASARAASAIGALVMAGFLWLEMRSREGREAATWAVAVLATLPFYFLGAQFANHDMLVAGCVTASIVCARQALRHDRATPWVLGAWAAAGLGVLAKGLIGIVLPVLVVVPALLWRRDLAALRRLAHPAGALVWAAIVLPWFVAMERRFPGFLDYFIVEQHFRRYTTDQFNNPQPLWFLPAAMAVLALPWVCWAGPALRRAWSQRRRAKVISAHARADLWWLFAVLLFFSLPRSKLVGYVLPALPALAALLARAAPMRTVAAGWTLAAAALTCLGLVMGIRAWPPGSHRDVAQALGSHWRAGEPVVFVEGPFFDLPFYAQQPVSPQIWSRWDDPKLPRRDDWRKELHDAARFAPQSKALLRSQDLPTVLCAGRPVWIVASPTFAPPAEWGQTQAILQGRHATLWRAEGHQAALCG